MNFDDWKKLFQNDCIAHDKVRAFDSLGEHVLRTLYENGLDPTIQAIVADGLNGRNHARGLSPCSNRAI